MNATPRLAVIASAISLLPIAAVAQVVNTPQFMSETEIDVLPTDVAVTPNGTLAVVRGTEDGVDRVRVWNLVTGVSSGPITLCSTSSPPWASGVHRVAGDLVETTDTRAIVIGSRNEWPDPDPAPPGDPIFTEDTTYVDILSLGAGGSASCVTTSAGTPANYRFSYSGGPGVPPSDQIFGDVSDVKITPDGTKAVVNHRNRIHVFNMSNGDVLAAFDISKDASGSPDAKSPLLTADSIALTNTRAIVITTGLKLCGPSTFRSTFWVYIVDLTSMTITPGWEIAASTCAEQDAHDVAITPDGSKAVVTGSEAMALFDLTNKALLAERVQSSQTRFFRTNADTVELTNDKAVVISDRFISAQPLAFEWIIEVFDITQGAGSLSNVRSFDYSGTLQRTRAHDLAIAPNRQWAVVKTTESNVVLQGLTGALSGITALPIASQGDPLADIAVGTSAFVSDSVIMTNTQAITIGSYFVNASNKLGYVDFIDFNGGTPVASTHQINTMGIALAADLKFSRDKFYAIVHVAAPPDDPGSTSGNDILFFNPTSHVLRASFGASGNVFGLDSLEVGEDRIISISEEWDAPPGYGGVVTGRGWVQVCKF